MPDKQRIVFHIDAYSPETIPMTKLATYMAEFAELLGRDNAVHYDKTLSGSTKLAAAVDPDDFHKVTDRLATLREGRAAKDVLKAFEKIDNHLADDNTIGRIYIEGGAETSNLLIFPGRDKPKPVVFGPFNQEGHLDGLLISVGGKDDSIPLRLQNGDLIYTHCETDRAMAKHLAKHLFEPVRVHGTGRWTREANGEWLLHKFRVRDFDLLDAQTLRQAVDQMRSVAGNGWTEFVDPLAELKALRRDEDELH